MNLSLLFQLCGMPLVIVLCLLGLFLTVGALFLAFKVKQIPLLVAFTPLGLLPVMVGVVTAMVMTLSSIEQHLDANSKVISEPGFLLLMNIVPILAGAIVAVPPTMICLVSRWALTWKASGVELFPKKEESDEKDSFEAQEKRETEDYLRDLVRPR